MNYGLVKLLNQIIHSSSKKSNKKIRTSTNRLWRFARIQIPEILRGKTNWNSELAACASMHRERETEWKSSGRILHPVEGSCAFWWDLDEQEYIGEPVQGGFEILITFCYQRFLVAHEHCKRRSPSAVPCGTLGFRKSGKIWQLQWRRRRCRRSCCGLGTARRKAGVWL